MGKMVAQNSPLGDLSPVAFIPFTYSLKQYSWHFEPALHPSTALRSCRQKKDIRRRESDSHPATRDFLLSGIGSRGRYHRKANANAKGPEPKQDCFWYYPIKEPLEKGGQA